MEFLCASLKSTLSQITGNVPQKNYDPAACLYPCINWSNTLIGGSYALNQLYIHANGYSRFKPDDIDIMVFADSFETFMRECKYFEKLTKCTLQRHVFTDPNDRRFLLEYNGSTQSFERLKLLKGTSFSDALEGVRTLHHAQLGKVQLFHINNKYSQSLLGSLAFKTDVPGCVHYSVHESNGNFIKIFHIPEKGVQFVLNDTCPRALVATESRVHKYTARGYTFTH